MSVEGRYTPQIDHASLFNLDYAASGHTGFQASGSYQPLNTNLTSLASLAFASTSFVKMTAAGTFGLDTNTYLTSLTGALLADGTVDLTGNWTIATKNITLTAGTLTAAILKDTGLTSGRVPVATTGGLLTDYSFFNYGITNALGWYLAGNNGGVGIDGGSISLISGASAGAGGLSGSINLDGGLTGATYGNVFIQRYGGNVFLGGTTTPTARLHLAAGTTVAGTAPLKLTSGDLLTTAEKGAFGFLNNGDSLTDWALYFTGTAHGTARRRIIMGPASNGALTITRIPFATTGGFLTDSASITTDGTTLTAGGFTTAGTVAGINVTSGADPGHTHSAYLTTVDISANTNLAVTSPIVLTGDTLSHAVTAGNIHLPTGGSANQILKNSGVSGTGSWGTVTENAGALAAITTLNMSGIATIGTTAVASTARIFAVDGSKNGLIVCQTGSYGALIGPASTEGITVDASGNWSTYGDYYFNYWSAGHIYICNGQGNSATSGNLAIGPATSVPTYKLEVWGTTYLKDAVTVDGNITIASAKNIVINTTTGTKIGTGITQKIGFWNATPVIQQTVAADATVATLITALTTIGLIKNT